LYAALIITAFAGRMVYGTTLTLELEMYSMEATERSINYPLMLVKVSFLLVIVKETGSCNIIFAHIWYREQRQTPVK